MTDIEPGWYRDPADPTTQRYWDGEGWLGDPLPAEATPPAGPPDVRLSGRGPGGRDALGIGDGPPDAGTDLIAGQPAPGSQAPGGPLDGGHSPGMPHLGEGAPPRGARPEGLPPGVPTLPYAVLRRLIPSPRPHGFALAPLSARFVARVIDVLAVLGLNILVNGWFVWRYMRELGPFVVELERRYLAGESTAGLTAPPQAGWLQMAILVLAAALWFAYEVPAMANSGQTPGKRLMHIKVMRVESDEPLGFGRAWRRWNPLGMPTLLWTCCGVGFLMQAGDLLIGVLDRPMRQAFHDKSAATVVVHIGPGDARPGQADPAQPDAQQDAQPPDDQQDAQPPDDRPDTDGPTGKDAAP